jgi:hypothetical protein
MNRPFVAELAGIAVDRYSRNLSFFRFDMRRFNSPQLPSAKGKVIAALLPSRPRGYGLGS